MSAGVAGKMDLWSLVLDQSEIDPDDLAAAIEREVQKAALDFRTRLLIRDSLDLLRRFWGVERTSEWLRKAESGDTIRAISNADLGPPGFSLLSRRIMPA